MHHHELTITEAEEILVGFFAEHETHKGFEVSGEGRGWSLFLSCPQCNITDTVAIDNEEYRRATGQLASEGVVLF